MDFVSRDFPSRPALILEDGSKVTYAALHEAIEKFSLGLKKRAVVFIIGENDYPSLLCYLSSLAHGTVPLLLGSGIQEAQLNALINVYDPQFIFHKAQRFDGANECTRVCQEGAYGLYARSGVAETALNEDLALLLATSGSTGSPKLVRLTLQHLAANASSIVEYLKIGINDRAITSLPFSYSYGLSVINSHLYAGASLVLTNRSMLDAQFWRLVQEHSVTSFAGVPYNYEILLKLRLANMKLPSVRKVTQAGGKLDDEKIQLIYGICQAKNIDFYSMYGQTEAAPRIAYLPTEDTVRKLGSIGMAIPGGRLWLEDSQGEVVLQPGVTGELVYAGPNVSLGYAESRGDLKLGDVNQGVLRTGDLAHFDEDGYFFIDGRKQRFLKIFGIRVSLDDVERMVTEMGYACAALGTDDHMVLHVIETSNLSADSLRNNMAESLGINKGAINVRLLTELPRLETGKVNYKWLSQLS